VTLASKLELKPLIQTIIDVTTVLTNADLGVFFLRDEASDSFITYAKAGARVPAMDEFPASVGNDFFGPDFASAGLAHARDLASSCAEGAVSRFQQALGARLHVRSCLTVPVVDLSDKVLGAMIFVALTPNAFSERSERILTSVATQAVVGIEKARLFQSVTAASDAKDQFLAMLSHELRTPLNPVMAIVSSLCGDPRVPGELAEDLAVVWRNIRLESRLIDDLLDFNRLIKGKMEIVHERLDVHEVIRSVIEICREELQAKGHHLTTDLGAAAHTISGDSGRLQQVLWNVLRNAVKFTPPGGRITVETSADRESLQVAITDTGHGIEEHALENIFRAFEQGTAKAGPQLGGLGLGLSIARMFVALHGGSIQATSGGLGAGACFTITLPLLAAAVPPAPARTPEVARGGGAKTGRILVVDDHEDTLRTLARLLNRRGYEVTMAASGAEAHQQLGAGAFDLLISDLGLPDCSGLDLLRRIRAERPLPAIALSGYGMEADLQNSAAAGFQAHLTKPVDFQELARLVESLLAAE
jgi:signal transduction histidine kinase